MQERGYEMTRSMQELRSYNESSQAQQVLCLAVVPRAGFKGNFATFPIYWLQADLPPYTSIEEFISDSEWGQALQEVLIDPLLEELWGAKPDERQPWIDAWRRDRFEWFAERQFQPGVTDNLARTVQEALELKGFFAKVASGGGYLFKGDAAPGKNAQAIENASRFHPLTDKFVVHQLTGNRRAEFLTFPAVHLPEPPAPEVINLDLSDDQLMAISQQRLLALNLEEMRVIRDYFKQEDTKRDRTWRGMPEWPTDVELEILAQTWSEHCKHKIFNAIISHRDGDAEPVTIESLYKTYIKKPTFDLMSQRSDLLSVFEDNSGVVRWNNEWAVCFKVETHNSPSALEPYGGALTGILGVNRDVLGTGLGAKPIFNTDVFCFAYPSEKLVDRPKLLPPKTILDGVRKGVQDGGNKSGIPTINGAIVFNDNYRAKPLVFCGTGGLLPTTVHKKSGFKKHTSMGDTIVMVGGRVGKDGIHGATFSSEALHEGSPVSAVQIGDPFTQKRVLDFIIEARDRGMITGITDNGAGGLSSSVGEMAQITQGATLELDNIPLKYPGLSDYEIVISESQERMTLSTRSFSELKRLAERYNVEATAIGTFNPKHYFEVTRKGKPVALLDLDFLHDGVPKLKLESEWRTPQFEVNVSAEPEDLKSFALSLLSNPNICSREQVIRQYDHEVQGSSVIKPLMGPLQQAPCDAAVFRPLYEEDAGLVVSNGICPELSFYDAYLMAQCAVDEAVRNAVCVGADPQTIVLLDNFCWPDPVYSERNTEGKYKLAQLVRTCQGLADAVRAYGTPLISGKDSMKNDFDDGTVRLSIPPTLLVSGMGRIERADAAISMDYKSCGDLIYILCAGGLGFAGSQYAATMGWLSDALPSLDATQAAELYRRIHSAVNEGWIKSCHDVSDGGTIVAVAESVIGSGLGAELKLSALKQSASVCNGHIDQDLLDRMDFALFAEGPARLIVSVQPELRDDWEAMWQGFHCVCIGEVVQQDSLTVTDDNGEPILQLGLSEMVASWKTPLPFD
jgi:phosphoribosylformylglycinamidine synthase subunit PurSL